MGATSIPTARAALARNLQEALHIPVYEGSPSSQNATMPACWVGWTGESGLPWVIVDETVIDPAMRGNQEIYELQSYIAARGADCEDVLFAALNEFRAELRRDKTLGGVVAQAFYTRAEIHSETTGKGPTATALVATTITAFS